METIIYEQAVTEQMRACLKIEQFFKRIDDFMQIDSPWAGESLARAVIDIVNLLDRSDIKAKLAKQMRELQETLQKHLHSPYCDQAQTQELLNALEQYQQYLHRLEGRLLQSLRDEPLLKTIKHCLQQPAGACSQDAPAMHHWLLQPYQRRLVTINLWLQQLNPVRAMVTVILHILRGSVDFKAKTANHGLYSQNLKAIKDCQLIRIKMSNDCQAYPEISAGRRHLNIRFMKDHKLSQDEINFELCTCH